MVGPAAIGRLLALAFFAVTWTAVSASGLVNGRRTPNVATSRHRRATPDICLQPMLPGSCGGRQDRYYYNAETQRCEQFAFGGCGGNENHFNTLLACLWTCERHVMPPMQNRIGDFTFGFCDSVCARGCTCRGTTVQCPGPLVTPPRVTTDCARTLDLSSSDLRVLHNDSFARLPSLTTLDLSGNSLRYIPVNAFRGLTSLKILRLSGNQLLQLPALALQHLPALEELDMSNNQLSFLACETIDNLPELRLVNVSNNNLRRLVAHQGIPLNQMTIDLRGNKLLSVRFPASSEMPQMYLADNPLQCDCAAHKTLSLFAESASRILDAPTCASPTSRRGMVFQDAAKLSEEALCVQKKPADVRALCLSPPTTGPCRARIRRYYYNLNNQRCEAFTYGGCLGTRNNFAALLACQHRCEIMAGKPTGAPYIAPTQAVPVPTCPPGEVYNDCGPACQHACNVTVLDHCTGLCVQGCYCPASFKRLYLEGPCVDESSEECRDAGGLTRVEATDTPTRQTRPPVPSPTTAAPTVGTTPAAPPMTTMSPPTTMFIDDKDKPVVADPSWPAPAYDADAWSRLEAVLFLPGADEGPSSHNIEYRLDGGQWRTLRMVPVSTVVSRLELPELIVSPGRQYQFRFQTIIGPSYSQYSDVITPRAPGPVTTMLVTTPPAPTTAAQTTTARSGPTAPSRPPAPVWPFPPTGSVGPDYIDLNLPALDVGIIELFQQLPGRGFEYVNRFPATGRVETRRVPAMPDTEYGFILRHVVNGTPSRRSRTERVTTIPVGPPGQEGPQTTQETPTEGVPPTPEWPGQGAAMVRDMAYEIVLPESPVPNLIYEVSVRSPITGRFSLFDTFAASPDSDRSVHLIQGVEPDTEYELVFRTRLGSKTSRPSPSLYVRTLRLGGIDEPVDTTRPVPATTEMLTLPATTQEPTTVPVVAPATTPADPRQLIGEAPMWVASVVIEPEKQSPEVITMVLPALSVAQINPADPIDYVVFARSLDPGFGWSQWEVVASEPITQPKPVPIQIVDVTPQTDYEFRFRTETASQISPFSTIIQFRTPAIGTPVWPEPPIDFSRSTPTSAVINLPTVIASQRPYVRGYTVLYRVADGNGNFDGPFLSRGGVVSNDQLEYVLGGLPVGSALQVVVEANNATDVSPRSPVVQLQLPDAPIMPQWVSEPIDLAASDSTTLTVLLPKVPEADRQHVESYTVQIRQPGGSGRWTTYAEGIAKEQVTLALTDLVRGSTVGIRVVPALTEVALRLGYNTGSSDELEVDLPEQAVTEAPSGGPGSSFRPTRYTAEWIISPAIQSRVDFFRVEYRQQEADGTFGSWVTGSTDLGRDVTSFDLVFIDSGIYEVRVLASFVTGAMFEVISPFRVNTNDLQPFDILVTPP